MTNDTIPINVNILLLNFFENSINGYERIKENIFESKKYKITSFNSYPNLYKITGINTSIKFLEKVDKNTYSSNFLLLDVLAILFS